jgi:hypothetical protein
MWFAGIVAGFSPERHGFDYAGVAFDAKLAVFDAGDASGQIRLPSSTGNDVYGKG